MAHEGEDRELPAACPYFQDVCTREGCEGTVPVGLPVFVPMGGLALGIQLKMCPADPRLADADRHIGAAVEQDEEYRQEIAEWLGWDPEDPDLREHCKNLKLML